MSFRLARFLYLTISLIIGSFFFGVGFFSMILPWSLHLKTAFSQLILNNTLILCLFGIGFTLTGLSIVIYTLFHIRHRYVEIQIGQNRVAIDEQVMRHYLDAYWQKHFPQAQIACDLRFKPNALQIVTDLPFIPLAEQKMFLEQVKHDFNALFRDVIGYPHDVCLIASFQSTKASST